MWYTCENTALFSKRSDITIVILFILAFENIERSQVLNNDTELQNVTILFRFQNIISLYVCSTDNEIKKKYMLKIKPKALFNLKIY